MSKKKNKKEATIAELPAAVAQPGQEFVDRGYRITAASLKDDFCNYSYEVTKGIGAGFKHPGVKGDGIVDPDMKLAFSKFKAHMAVSDDLFKHADIEVDNIDDMHDNPLTDLFDVTGFKITGSEDDESIELTGTKWVSTGARNTVVQKIPMYSNSPNKWYNELKSAADKARLEVALYNEGKYTKEEAPEEEEKDPAQLSILDQAEESDDYFKEAKVED